MEIDEISKFLSPITVGFLAAYLGSILALKKSKQEKLWDERRTIYKEVIEAFEELHHWSEYTRASHFCEPVIEEEMRFDESLRTISKHCVSGSLFLSVGFHSELHVANSALYNARFQINEDSLPDRDSERERQEWLVLLASKIRAIIDTHLPKLIKIASNELPK